MFGVTLFLCPQCGRGRQLPPHAVDTRVRCLECETSFRSEGYLYRAAEWETETDPFALTRVADGMGCPLTDRKLRLLACVLARSAFDWCRNPWFRDALQSAERWADSGTAPRGIEQCRRHLDQIERTSFFGPYLTAEEVAFQQWQEREQFGWIALALRAVSDDPRLQPDELTDANRPLAASLVRELSPNPFIPFTWEPDWLTSTVRDLAQHIYAKRDFGAMPILADALQDAGCESDDILSHCRANRPHARGCWMLDAILGKS